VARRERSPGSLDPRKKLNKLKRGETSTRRRGKGELPVEVESISNRVLSEGRGKPGFFFQIASLSGQEE